LKWTISQLQKIRDKHLQIDEIVDVTDIKERDPQIRDVSPMKVTGRADIGSTKVTFHLHLSGKFILPCSRTLVDVNYPIDIETTETFLFKTAGIEYDGDDVTIVEGDVVDLLPVIKENLLLEIPMQVFVRMLTSKKLLLNLEMTGLLFLKKKTNRKWILDSQSLPIFLKTIKNLN
jgi:uncharacterized protein